MKLFVKYGIFLFASVIALNSYNIKADESSTTSTDTSVSDTKEPATHEIIIGNNANSLSSLKQDEKNGSTEPTITNVEISGGVDPSVTGTDFFKDVEINLEGNNLTDDNFLTEEGLHWSDKTYTEIIQGKENGIINDPERFGASNTPSTPVIAYSTNVGDSGRINYIGKTLSGIELDLLWTVLESDKDEWASNSGYNDNRPKGLGFAGEQSILGATGNSIVILYNNASNLALHYQIVKHGTKIEQPVVVSFISTDIDAAQGVQTNLANLVEIIPTESNLVKKDGIIYDTTPGVVGLNGSKDLPKGGYLGAGFISNFDYTFYSPAPERVNDSYSYPMAVRYDIFGSSLQANIKSRISRSIIVQYVDNHGKELKKTEFYKGFDDESYKVDSIRIKDYRLIDVKKFSESWGRTRIQFAYQKEFPVTLKFQDENGKVLSESVKYIALDGQKVTHTPKVISGYRTPERFEVLVNQPLTKVFTYKKIQQPIHQVLINKNKGKESQSQLALVGHPLVPPNSASQSYDTNTRVQYHSSKSYVPTPTFSHYGNHLGIEQYNSPGLPIPKTIPKSQEKSQEKPSKNEKQKDPFLVNTNMTKDEKKDFLTYIKSVGDEARKKYGKDHDKINHTIANAIARVPYADDKLQSMTNDFGEASNSLSKEVIDLLSRLHKNENYPIDFPHLAAPIATSYRSGFLKEIVKLFAGLSPYNTRLSTEEILFQNNSLVGDLLTTIDKKDFLTDIDAYILKYHSEFKDMDLDQAIEKYYSTDNLEQKRQEYYSQALEEQSKNIPTDSYKSLLLIGSIASLSGIALIALRKLKKWEPLKSQAITFIKQPLKFFEKNLTAPIRRNLVRLSNNTIQTVSKINKNFIKPVANFTINKIAKPVYNSIRTVTKPIVQFVNNTVVKPVGKVVYNNISKPVYNRIVKPVSGFVNRNIIKPVYNKIVKPVYNRVVRPIVRPIYQKVVRPIAKATKRYIVRPVVNTVKRFVVNPVKKLFGRRRGRRR
ncbi:MucBP domain-containing protein [Streptococcus salivarius]|uniref:MucBP domain-containing protein n=1 Tax=Streptococcus salivarius TaxID=1304 RepID=UPI0018A93592|nr:MucBP domain-containing protein [Streptococcus salivarius]MDB8610367.1 MucBP domain-containing protein [Streptococcus salivarius]